MIDRRENYFFDFLNLSFKKFHSNAEYNIDFKHVLLFTVSYIPLVIWLIQYIRCGNIL